MGGACHVSPWRKGMRQSSMIWKPKQNNIFFARSLRMQGHTVLGPIASMPRASVYNTSSERGAPLGADASLHYLAMCVSPCRPPAPFFHAKYTSESQQLQMIYSHPPTEDLLFRHGCSVGCLDHICDIKGRDSNFHSKHTRRRPLMKYGFWL